MSLYSSRIMNFRYISKLLPACHPRGTIPLGILRSKCQDTVGMVSMPTFKFGSLSSIQVNSERLIHSSSANENRGDLEMSEFLSEEIELEEKASSKMSDLKSIKHFILEKCDNCSVTFSRQIDGDTVKIHFNVNHSIEDTLDVDEESSEQNEPELESRPPFTVEINKGGDKSLFINCRFTGPMVEENEDDANGEDMIEIVDTAICKVGQEVGETDYVLEGQVMDPNLYDLLLSMMEERGVNANCVEDLVKFSTAHEHKMYVNFLKSLHNLVTSK